MDAKTIDLIKTSFAMLKPYRQTVLDKLSRDLGRPVAPELFLRFEGFLVLLETKKFPSEYFSALAKDLDPMDIHFSAVAKTLAFFFDPTWSGDLEKAWTRLSWWIEDQISSSSDKSLRPHG